ncbi:MAG: hypothetical protein M1820_003512 [Bogoriella megaspora]|nr:MAG: hypothetical protein M1820_003512 [Bogoriella megaspora]
MSLLRQATWTLQKQPKGKVHQQIIHHFVTVSTMTSEDKKSIVIIGGGIIGCTSAYFLTRHPSFSPEKHNITLIEATKIAGGASGKAGGLLALWAYPSAIVPLSFRLHEQLAKEHDGEERWGYRKTNCGSIMAKGRPIPPKGSVKGKTGEMNGQNGDLEEKESLSLQKQSKEAKGKLRAAGVPSDLDWVDAGSTVGYSAMAGPDETAQVHPYQFTTSMAQLAAEAGAKIVLGSITNIDRGTDGKAVRGVTYKDKTSGESIDLPASDVIIAAGPWTQKVFPKAPISAMRAHSVTIRPTRPVSAYALFTELDLPKDFGGRGNESLKGVRRMGKTVTPEIYARPKNEVYACGEGDNEVPFPPSTDEVQVDEGRCQDIVDYVGSISDELRDGEVTARQACYLPNVALGSGPLIGETGVKGLLMAAGHTCWGIQNGTGTGKLISEFVFDGKAKSATVGSLDPRRVL